MNRDHQTCPRCSARLAGHPPEAPWCPACEWNLARYDRFAVASEWGNRQLDRVAHRVAFGLDRITFRRLSGGSAGRRGGRAGRGLLLVLCALVAALGPAALLGGGWLIAAGSGATPYLGLALVLLAVVLRPRLRRGRPDWFWEVPREEAPAFYALLERTAAATGAPMPAVVGFSAQVNASAGHWGRYRYLDIGLPLWAALPAQPRVALLAHEFGHFVNHDVRDRRLVALARRTLATLVDTLGRTLLRVFGPFALPVVLPLDAALALLLILGQRDGQRAEYLADGLAADAAGGPAVAALLTLLLVGEELIPTLRAIRGRAARPEDWRTAGVQALRNAGDLRVREQRSLRAEASLLATHPPVGRRIRMAAAHPAGRAPAVELSEAEAERIDAELAPWYDRLRARAAEAAYI
ncbi:M48 family metallopeptidase [Dactylosporangium sp. NPDC000244]|uniref:M48 family metallopeptidase n=1 Tax=Dactylosporangium sp. NPDC000244 TaxID=3154365 RepID=UPI00332A783C